ncbi:MAG: hypothetical protein WB615_05950 [Candidatus Tumulicola sp.]
MKTSVLAIAAFVLVVVGLSGCGGGKSSANATASSAPMSAASDATDSTAKGAMGSAGGAIPNCGAVHAVWVNLSSKVYHEPGDPYYGKTKHGEYLCPSQAKAQGFHLAGSGAMSGRRPAKNSGETSP